MKLSKDFPFPIESVRSSSDFSGVVRRGNNPDFLIVDTPPGGLSFITESAEAADLVLLPTGVSPMDIDRTQVTLSSETPAISFPSFTSQSTSGAQ